MISVMGNKVVAIYYVEVDLISVVMYGDFAFSRYRSIHGFHSYKQNGTFPLSLPYPGERVMY